MSNRDQPIDLYRAFKFFLAQMRNFTVRKSFLLICDGRLRLYLELDHTTIYIRLRPSIQNLRFGQRIRMAMLEEKVILPMRGINEYCGRAAFFR